MTITKDRPFPEEAAIYDTTQPRDVVAALARVLVELGGIEKLTAQERSRRGMGGGDTGINYAYRGIDQIAGAAQPLLGKYGVVIVPVVEDSRTEQITVNNRPWTDTWVRVTWTVYGPGGPQDCIIAVTEGLGRDNADKGHNKAMTSAAKNLLLRLLMIGDSNDDSDGHTYERDQGDDRPKPLTDSWMATWRSQMTEQGIDPDMVLWTAFGNQVPNPLMPEHIPAMRDAFEKMKKDRTPSEPEQDRPSTATQIGQIKAEYGRLGMARAGQLELTGELVGREVHSHNQLNVDEADMLLAELHRRQRDGAPGE